MIENVDQLAELHGKTKVQIINDHNTLMQEEVERLHKELQKAQRTIRALKGHITRKRREMGYEGMERLAAGNVVLGCVRDTRATVDTGPVPVQECTPGTHCG